MGYLLCHPYEPLMYPRLNLKSSNPIKKYSILQCYFAVVKADINHMKQYNNFIIQMHCDSDYASNLMNWISISSILHLLHD